MFFFPCLPSSFPFSLLFAFFSFSFSFCLVCVCSVPGVGCSRGLMLFGPLFGRRCVSHGRQQPSNNRPNNRGDDVVLVALVYQVEKKVRSVSVCVCVCVCCLRRQPQVASWSAVELLVGRQVNGKGWMDEPATCGHRVGGRS